MDNVYRPKQIRNQSLKAKINKTYDINNDFPSLSNDSNVNLIETNNKQSWSSIIKIENDKPEIVKPKNIVKKSSTIEPNIKEESELILEIEKVDLVDEDGFMIVKNGIKNIKETKKKKQYKSSDEFNELVKSVIKIQ